MTDVSLREQATARTRSGRPRTPSFLRLQNAVGPGGALPAGVAGLAPLAKRPRQRR